MVRGYDYNASDSDKISIWLRCPNSDVMSKWQAARVSIGIPYLFRKMQILGKTYSSGCLDVPNPTSAAISEIEGLGKQLKLVISLGFFPLEPKTPSEFRRLLAKDEYQFRAHQDAAKALGASYYRMMHFDDLSLASEPSWNSDNSTEQMDFYLKIPKIMSKIKEIAARLVDIRRRREAFDPEHWRKRCEYVVPGPSTTTPTPPAH